MDKASKALTPGTLVDVVDDKEGQFGTAYFNPHSLIAARILAPKAGAKIDAEFFRERFEPRARFARQNYSRTPFYRLIHAEADFCPGLVVDRFDDVLVAQSGTAGMDALAALWLEALRAEFSPRAIVVKSNSPSRAHEGLKDDVRIAHGDLERPAHVEEAGIRHRVDPLTGQKTGWFYDQRDNRAFLIALAKGRNPSRRIFLHRRTGARRPESRREVGGFARLLAKRARRGNRHGTRERPDRSRRVSPLRRAGGVGGIGARGRVLRHRLLRSAALRALEEGSGVRRPRVSQTRPPRGRACGAGRIPLPRLLQPRHRRRTLPAGMRDGHFARRIAPRA